MWSLQEQLDKRKADGLYRTRRVTDGPQGPELVVAGRRMLAFCSNDYLGWPRTRDSPRRSSAASRATASGPVPHT